jgi:transcription elongation factor GreA
MATVDKMPMLAEGYERLAERSAAPEDGRAPVDHRRDREERARMATFPKMRISCPAKERQGQVEAQIADIDGPAEPRDGDRHPPRLSGDKVVFGATVHLLDENDNKIVYQSSARPRRTPRSGVSATIHR